ncbi:hypothetical protein M5D96_013003 [Drosophila gunungcola]|uniref:Cubilin homolog n=1 Tax=Drosophila gunungcola TaxID=103775 RepID=A0A9P9YCZ6_9MUSC|nr:hypothetical protein M5D96_013003 [Drosophila gunungcola]
MEILTASSGAKKRSGGAKDEWNTAEDFVDVRELSDQLSDFQRRAFGPNGLNDKLRLQQNRTRGSLALMRRFQTRLRAVENRVDRLKTQIETNSCASGPCDNGGTCYNTFNGFRCQCRPAFEGTKCEVDVNECALYEGTDLGCQNGGQCQNQFGSYSCLCQPGWHGMHCSQRKADCSQSSAWELCGHGSCVPSSDDASYRCLCEPGWKTNGLTPVCGEDVDECSDTAAHTPCSTKCINLPGSFTCAPCAAGLTGNGVSCRDVDECQTNNGGCSLSPKVDCINSYGSYHCGECPLGWTGDGRKCERSAQDFDAQSGGQPPRSCPAGNNPCYPGASCFVISGTASCRCPVGMVGSGYGLMGCVNGTTTNCLGSPCLNDGICLDAGPSNFTCICPSGFRLPICEPVPSPCDLHPCKNGGRCRQTVTGGQNDFVCQCTPGYRGRLCETRFSSCNGMLSAPSGRLRYPPEGTGYEHNAQCAWVIRTNESLVVNVTFHSFDVEDATECRFDWLQINDGRSAAAQIIGRYCGSHLPHGGNIVSSGNQLYLWFRSDNSTAKEGFDLSWNSMQPQCGGRLEFDTHGTLASPGSPGNYPKNRDCQWQLVAPKNKRIKLTFFSLQLEEHANCNFDYVQITDTISGRELAKYCTTGAPAPLLLPTHQAEIQFHSDAEGSDTGFQLHYSTEEGLPGCGGTYTTKQGTITESTLDYAEPEGISCEYEIQLALGEAVEITFGSLELGPLDCLEIWEPNPDGDIMHQKYCGPNAPRKPPAQVSQGNRLRVKFYGRAGRFELQYRLACNWIIDDATKTIASLGYPNNVTRVDRMCPFTLIATTSLISLKVIDFQLSSGDDDDDECLTTNLRFNDGKNRRILGPYCDKNPPPKTIVSETNDLVIQLTTDARSTGRGVKLEWSYPPVGSDHCGGVFYKSGTHIRMPVDSDGEYASDASCYWVIVVPAHKAVRLHWLSFSTEGSLECSFDYLEIYDSLNAQTGDEKAKPLAKYCDSRVPEDLIVHAGHVVVKFVSDYSYSEGGFELVFTFEEPAQCGGHVHANSGELTSPDFPANYSNNLHCDWRLTGGMGQLLEIQLDLFDLELSSNCSSDYLEIRNGANTDSPLIGRFCGRNIPTRIPSHTHEMRLILHTNAAISGHGFRLRWRVFAFGCGGHIRSNTGVISSPRYPNPYPHSIHCDWWIKMHPGSGVSLTFEDLQLESLSNCYYDSVKIFTGSRKPNQMAERTYCKELDDPKDRLIQMESSEVTVTFDSDSSTALRGFRMAFNANCVRNLTATWGSIESLNYMEPFWETIPVNCSWTIRAPKGNGIRLEVSHWERHEEHMGTADIPKGLYIADGRKVQEIVGPGAVNASGEVLTVIHNASTVNFQLDYRIDGCLEELRGDSGSFKSPNHPNMYPNNVECYWLITVKPERTVELTITNLDLEESLNCTKDALTVSNHKDIAETHERHCGSTDKLVLTSSGYRMHVRFTSDESHNGRGFSASYRTVKASCGGKISTRNGVIESPNYPLGYPINSHCEWQVEVSPHHKIVFEMQDLELELGNDCAWDYLEGYDLAEDDTEGRRLFKLCGDLKEENTLLMSATNLAVVRFVSDDSVTRKGFRLHFHESCGQTMARQAPRNESCLWVLQAQEANKRVSFTPTHVKLRDGANSLYPTEGDCMPVGVKIYEGVEAVGTPRLRYCRSHPPALISNGQALTISVPLQLVEEFEGHYMTMDTSCGSLYNALSGRFSSPYYPGSYPPNIECIWILEASVGNSLSLTLESMDMERSEGCNRDYLEVREDSERGKLIGVYCGTEVPGAIHSRGSIWMKFKSDDDNVGEGFLASYNYEHHNELNGTDGIIESPHYPSKFQDTQPYSWRITVDKEYVVVLEVRHLRDLDQPHLSFYDGYSDIGARIAWGADVQAPIRSSTNVLYFTAKRGPFKLTWQRLSKEALRSNRTAEEQTRLCGQQLVTIDRSVIGFHSPGYPNGYELGLKCAWSLVPSNPAVHAVLQLSQLDLEVFGGENECIADYVRISSSGDLHNWSDLAKLCSLPSETKARVFHGQPYLRVEFVTDSSINKTGFNGIVRTMCGSEITASRGQVNITDVLLRAGGGSQTQDCIWRLKVRQGRRIKLDFPDFQLQNNNNNAGNVHDCSNYLLLRNGNDEDSPFLGRGKYCEDVAHEVLETSSNRAYVKFHFTPLSRSLMTFRFEELSHACSARIQLTVGQDTQTITTPYYPNLPHPHSECIWIVEAPPEHRIMLHFQGDFDLVEAEEGGKDCQREFVLVNDGSTELKPEIGRYCGSRKPDTQYSTGNQLRIRYYTDVSEPHKGFNASVQLARCGGFFSSPEGTIASPPRELLQVHRAIKQLDECVYTIELEKGSTIDMTITHMDIPKLANGSCSQRHHLLLEEIDAFGLDGEERIVDTLMMCGVDGHHLMGETNKIVFRYRFLDGIPAESQGFAFVYNSLGSRCGETIRASMGVLQTPGYPVRVPRPVHCVWWLEVPKGRRVRLEILDFNSGAGGRNYGGIGGLMTFHGRLTVANDYRMQSILGRYNNDPPAELISSDNTMGIDTFLLPIGHGRGVKLRFSAYGTSSCPHFAFQQNVAKEMEFRRDNVSNPVHCSYSIRPEVNHTILIQLLTCEAVQHNLRDDAEFASLLAALAAQDEPLGPRGGFDAANPLQLCAATPGKLPPSIRVPFPLQLVVSGTTRNSLSNLVLGYSMQNCGGGIFLEPGDNMTVQQPSGMEAIVGAIDCAWAIGPYLDAGGEDEVMPQDIQLEVSLQVNLPTPAPAAGSEESPCQHHFLNVYNGPDQSSPSLGVFCNQASAVNIVVERGLFLEYHADSFSPNATFNVSIKYGSGCGGKLTYPYRPIDFSEQYKNNVECIWEVEATAGYHIGLTFHGRFYIEDSAGCTKDYLLVQQRNDTTGNWTDLQRICGRAPPDMINTTSPYLRLIFRSDDQMVGDGFLAKFERNCGGLLFANDDDDEGPQQLTSPGYPTGYEKNLQCNWTIVPGNPSMGGVLITFEQFDLEQSPISVCLFDNLTITTKDKDKEPVQTTLCGVKHGHTYRAKESINLLFRTDSSFSGRGFVLNYSSRLCGGMITQTTQIQSPASAYG